MMILVTCISPYGLMYFWRHLARTALKKLGYQKSLFLIFVARFFVLFFCCFFKKIMNCICYGQFLAAQGVMSIGVFLRPPVLIWFDKTLRTHTQQNRIFKISLIPRRKSLREIPQILHFLKIRHRQENSVLALRLLILKLASNWYMVRRVFGCFSDAEI